MTLPTCAVVDTEVKEFLKSTLEPLCDSIMVAPEVLLVMLLKELATPPMTTTLRVDRLKIDRDNKMKKIKALINEMYRERGATPPDILVHDTIDDLVMVPNVGPCSEKVKPQYPNIIVGLLCGCSVLRGADVFAPGVLGAPKGVTKGQVVSVFADVDGSCRKGLVVPYEGKTVFVGNGLLVQDRGDWFRENPSKGIAIRMTNPLYVSPSLDLSCDESCDLYYPQNLPSVVTSHILDPQPSEVILDMCAAPGGKTTHIASLLGNTGCIVAIDKTPNKIAKLLTTVEKFHCSAVIHCFAHDSTSLSFDKAPAFCPKAPLPPPYPLGTFDRILLDGPCSGLGQRPLLKVTLKLAEIKSYQAYQRKLIKQAVLLLKEGGIFVYSTCTITPQENEEQVKWILDNYPLQLSDQTPILGYPGLPMYGLDSEQCMKVQRFGPQKFFMSIFNSMDDKVDCIGFFIAKFIKRRT